MVCDTNTTEQRHGLGLLIVRQIAESHGGRAKIRKSAHGGFAAEMALPRSGYETEATKMPGSENG